MKNDRINEENLTLGELKRLKVEEILKSKREEVKQEIGLQESQEKQKTEVSDKIAQDQLLYQQLAKKWAIELQQQQQKDETLLEQEKNQKLITQLMEDRKLRRPTKFQQLTKDIEAEKMSQMLIKKNEYDSQEPIPLQYEYLIKRNPKLAPPMNIGQKWGNLIEQSELKKFQDRSLAPTNFFWMMTRRGRLGSDLLNISFGIIGIFILPIYFYKRHKQNQKFYKKEIKYRSSVDDWENSIIDIDDVSDVQYNYNMFSDEIDQFMTEQMKLSQEIQDLISLIYKPKTQ